MISWPDGTGRISLTQVDSTNAEAMRRATGGDPTPFWVIADHQTAGRGRRGRDWLSGTGNFYASHAMVVEGAPREAALRSFVAALALFDALVAAGVRADRVSLKWPNDVLLDGRKLAGILLESTVQGAGTLLVTGIGVNLAHAPDAESLEAGAVDPVALSETGIAVNPTEFLDRLGPAFAHWERAFRAQGFAAVREPWLARAARLGGDITAKLPTETLSGRFEGVDADGALVLSTDTGRRVIHAADVYFG